MKRLQLYLLIVFSICLNFNVLSQAPPWQWAKQASSAALEVATDVATFPSTGDVFATGIYSGGLNGATAFNSATFTATNGGTDAYIAKYNSVGTFQWAIEIGGAGNDGGQSIALDAAGNIYITGYFNGTVDFDPSAGIANVTSTGGQDVFIAKYSPAGAFLWAVKGGGASTDIGYGIYVDANGVYVTGAYLSSAVFTSTSVATAATTAAQVGNNVFVAKYSQGGVVQWVASAGSTLNEEGFDVTADANRVYIIGDYRNTLSIYNSAGVLAGTSLVVQSSPNTEIFVIAYTQAGGFGWATNVSSTGNDRGRGIANDGTNLYITGAISNSARFPNPGPVFTQTVSGAVGTDAFAAKMNGTTGVYQWVRQLQGTAGVNDQSNAIAYHPLGRIYISGYYTTQLTFAAMGGPVLNAVNSTDIFVASFTSNNGFYYALSGGGTGFDVPYGIGLNNAADAYIGGSYAGPSTFGTTTLAVNTNSNVVVAKCGCGVVLSMPNAGVDQTVCATTATMAASTPTAGTGAWTVLSGAGVFGTPSSPTSSVSGLALGDNYFIWTISGSGCTANKDTVKVRRELTPSTSVAGASQSICATATVMAANTPTTGAGAWSVVSGVGTPTTLSSPTTGVTGIGVGVSVYQWAISYLACPVQTSTMSITRYAPPTPANAGISQTVCATTATMAANTTSAGIGTWSLLSGTATITTPTLNTTGITGLGVGTSVFQWQTSNGVCTVSNATMSITRDAPPTPANAGPSQSICATSTVMAANTTSVGTGTWSLLSGTATITTPTLNTTGITGLGVGTSVFQWQTSNGVCASTTSTMSITRYAPPTPANAGISQTVCATTATMAANTTSAGIGTWSLLSGTATITTPTLNTTGITGLGVGTSVFQWQTSNGVCASTTSTMSITRDAPPTPANAGPSQSICATSTVMAANTTSVGTGTWSLLSGTATITTPTLNTTGITGLGVGTSVFQWQTSNGVCASTTSTMSITRYAPPTPANAGISQTVCATTATMAANTTSAGIGTWSLLSGTATITTPTLNTTGITGLGVGTSVFQWQTSNGVCTVSNATMSITRDAPPTPANAGPSQSICATSTVMAANTTSVGTGTWSLLSGTATITTPTLNTTGITGLGVGTSVFQWQTSNGVCASTTSTMSITRYAPPTPANAGISQTVCATTATMAANTTSAGIGTWSLLSGTATITTPTLNTTGITGLGVGTSVFQWQTSNGVCAVSNATMSITRDAPPTPANAGPSQSICATSTVMAANTTSVGTGTWSLLSGTATITTPTLNTTGITGLGVGTSVFQWQTSNGVCASTTSTMSITQYAPPSIANAGTTQTVCATTATLNAASPAVGTGSWTLISGSGVITSPTLPNSGVTALGVGVNTFSWTVTNGVCAPSSATVNIVRDDFPTVANAGPGQTVCTTTATFAGNSPTVGLGTWSLISGSGVPTAVNNPASTVNFLSVGTNVFQWSISNGVCPATTSTVAIIRNQVPTNANAGISQTLCTAFASLNGNVPAVGTGTWILVSGTGVVTTPTLANSGITGLAVGTNIFQWTITNGVCPPSTSTVAIIRDPNPTVSNAGSTQTLCLSTATMTGNTPAIGTGLWTLVSGSGVITTPTSPTTGITALGTGTNVFQWTISNGTCPPSSSTVAIIRTPPPTIATAGVSQTICASVYTVTGNTPSVGTGSWTVISGTGTFASATSPTTGVTGLSVGNNVFDWTIYSGVCAPSVATVTITVDPFPTVSNAGSTQTICVSTATFAGNAPAIGTGVWSLVSGTGVITTPSSPNSGITGISTGTNVFQWTISNGTCPPSTSTVAIIRDVPPTMASSSVPSQTLCSTTATITGNIPAVGTGSWTVISGTGSPSSFFTNTTTVTGISIGTEVYQWSISNGVCPSSTVNVTVTRDPLPTVSNAGTTQTVCSSSAILAGNLPAIGTGSWTLVSGGGAITTPTSPGSGITGLSPGTNVLQWTISNGTCPPSTSTVAIIRDLPPTISSAGSTSNICTSTITLNGNTPVTGIGNWSLVSGNGVFTSPNSPNTAVTGITTGTNVYQWTINNGVCAPSTSTVMVIRDPNPTVSNAGTTQTVCSASATLAGNTPVVGTGVWTLVSGTGVITTPTSPTTGVTGISTGTNVFQWTISNGTCPPSISSVTIIRDQNPTNASSPVPSQTLCSGTATLIGNVPAVGTGSWSAVSGTGSILSYFTNTTTVTGISVGTEVYQWSISNGVCPASTVNVTVIRDPLPTTSNAGLTQTICATTATLGGNIPAIGTGLWTLVSGTGVITSPTSPNSGVTGISTGTNVFQWTISNGTCPPSSSTVAIIRDPFPTPAVAGTNSVVCSLNATLSGNIPVIGVGSWSQLIGSGSLATPLSNTCAVSGLSVGVNVFQWSISNGVCPASTSTVSVTRDDLPSMSNAGPTQTICATTATLAGNTPLVGTGTWSVISGSGILTNSTSPTSVITALGVGNNFIQWSITNGVCPVSTSTVNVYVYTLSTVSNAGTNQTICSSITNLAGNTPTVGSGSWSILTGPGSVSTPTNPVSLVTGLGLGVNVFQWTIVNGVCPPSISTVQVFVDTNPTTANAGSNQTICSTTVSLTGNTPVVGSGLWTLVSGAGTIISPTSAITNVTGLGVGANVFQWTISNGTCPPSTASVTITRDDFPTTAVAGINTTICATATVMAANTPIVGNGSWTVLSGGSTVVTSTLATSSVTNLAVGLNTYQWTISNGVCPLTTSTVSIVRDDFPSIANAGLSQTLCASSNSTILSGNTPLVGTGTWSVISGSAIITTSTNPNATATAISTATSNILEWTISNGVCPVTTSTMSIQVDDVPSAASITSPVSQTICVSTPSTTISGNTPTVGVGTWSIVSGSGTITSPNSPTTAITGMTVGTTTLQWIISNGVCTSSLATTTIQVDDVPSAASITSPVSQTICVSTPSTTISGNTPTVGVGTWSIVSGSGTITSPNSPTTAITGMTVGTTTLQWIISNGVCTSSLATTTIQVDDVPSAASITSPVSQTICVSTPSTTISGNTPTVGVGTWSIVSGSGTITSPNSPTTAITGMTVGTTTLQWIISNGVCTSSLATTTIQVDDVPSAAVITSPVSQTICVSTPSTTISGNTPTVGIGTWSIVAGSGTITSPNSPTTAITGMTVGTTTLQWIISNGVCTSSLATTTIQVDDVPSAASITSPVSQTICVSTPSTTISGNTPTVGVGTWSIVSGSGTITSPNSPTTAITGMTVGTTTLQWIISNGVCTSSLATTTIQVDDVPSAASITSPVSQTICVSTPSTTISGNTPTVGVGTWSIVSGSGTITSPNSPTTAITGMTVGTTTLQWIISNGVCTSSLATTTIQVDDVPSAASITSPVSQTICVSTPSTTISGNTPTVGVGTWSIVSGSGTITSPNSPTTAITGMTVGTTTLQWIISNGVCTSSLATTTIQVDDVPSAASITSPVSQTICVSTPSTTISGNTPTVGVGTWSIVSGSGTITSPNSPTTAITGMTVGTTTLQWIISNGVCTSSLATTTIQVDDVPSAASITSPVSQTICVSTPSTTISGNTPTVGVGTWSIVSGSGTITSPNSPTTAITGMTVGTTTLQWIISNGVCTSSLATTTIQVDDVPSAASITSPVSQTICVSTPSTTISGNTPTVGVGTWSIVSGSGTITSPNSPTTAITGMTVGTTTLQWIISNGVCTSSLATTTIQVDDVPSAASITSPVSQTICVSTPSTTISGNTPTVGVGTWSIVSGSGTITSPNSPTTAITGMTVGTTTLQWIISNGVCTSSLATTTIQVDDVPTTSNAGASQTICVSTGSATLAGNTPTVGVGTWSIVSGSGVVTAINNPSSTITGLTVGTTILQWSIANGVCLNSVSTMSIQVDQVPTTAVIANSSQTLCVSTPSTTVIGNTPTVGVGTWSIISGSGVVVSPNTPTTAVTGLTPGTTILQWMIANGTCTSSIATATIQTDAMPSIANAGPDETRCSPNATLAAVMPAIGTGFWNVLSGGGAVTTPTLNTSTVGSLTVGLNSLEWVVSNGVCPSTRDTMQINVLINLLPIVAGPDQFVCSLSTTLNATPHAIGTGSWMPVGTAPAIATPTNPNSPVTFTNQGTYTYVWTVGYLTCPTESDTVKITTYLNPSLALAGADQYICTLNASLFGNTPSIGTGTWLPLSIEPPAVSPSSPATAVNFTTAGVYTYIWAIGNGNCPVSNDTVIVTAYAPVTIANAGPDQIICGYNSTFAGNLPVVGAGTWSPLVAATSTVNNILSQNSAVNMIGQGTFGFVWTISTGTTCPSSSDTVYIQTYSLPSIANAGPDITSDILNNLMAANNPTVGVGTWSILNGSGNFSNGNDPLSNFTAPGDGTYVLVWTISNGVCANQSDTMILIINPMLIPQVITPNGDGNNDFFEVRAMKDLQNVKIEIYNRWGNVVYSNNDYKNNFKGENGSGEKLADDTYFYLLEAEGKMYKGYFVIKTN